MPFSCSLSNAKISAMKNEKHPYWPKKRIGQALVKALFSVHEILPRFFQVSFEEAVVEKHTIQLGLPCDSRKGRYPRLCQVTVGRFCRLGFGAHSVSR